MPIDLLELPMPVTLRPGSPITDEALMRFSEENKPYKIERNKYGEIVIMTPVGGIGSTHEAYVAYQLFHWNETAQTGMAFASNAGFNLPDGSCLSPDASWLALDRWNALTHEQKAGYPPLCPDFLIEVRSQSDARAAVEAKMQLWLDNGAQLAWLVDPIDANATIYRPRHAPETLHHPEAVQGEGPVAGFELPCSQALAPALAAAPHRDWTPPPLSYKVLPPQSTPARPGQLCPANPPARCPNTGEGGGPPVRRIQKRMYSPGCGTQ